MAVCPSNRSQPRGSIMMSGKSRFCLSLMVGEQDADRLQAVVGGGQYRAGLAGVDDQGAAGVVAPRPDVVVVERRQRQQVHRRWFPGPLELRPCRSEEHTSELQSLMRSSYAVFCL